MRLLHRFRALSSDERRLLIRAVLLLAVIRLGLGRLPFTALRRLVTHDWQKARLAAGDHRQVADRIVWAVTAAASRRVPGPTTCLSRALAVHAMLSRRGYPSRLHIGVVRGGEGELEGHAWVESDGRVLIGGTASEIGQFTRLAAFGVETVFGQRSVGTLQEGR